MTCGLAGPQTAGSPGIEDLQVAWQRVAGALGHSRDYVCRQARAARAECQLVVPERRCGAQQQRPPQCRNCILPPRLVLDGLPSMGLKLQVAGNSSNWPYGHWSCGQPWAVNCCKWPFDRSTGSQSGMQEVFAALQHSPCSLSWSTWSRSTSRCLALAPPSPRCWRVSSAASLEV